MRLSFGNGEHADFVVEEGAVSLGNAEGNTFVLSDRDVAPRHARLTVDARGAVLEVLDPRARTHVNARPVREKALLRSGDVLCLGQVTIALKADRDDIVETSLPAATEATSPSPQHPPRVILRGVSGSHYGKTIAVNHQLSVGSAADCGLVVDEARIAPRHATIENVGDAIYLRSAAGGSAFVNGVRVRDAIVYPGDQLAFERSHFVIEAPALPQRGAAVETVADIEAAQAQREIAAATDEDAAQGAIWWLIGAAAVIAAGIALMIWRGA